MSYLGKTKIEVLSPYQSTIGLSWIEGEGLCKKHRSIFSNRYFLFSVFHIDLSLNSFLKIFFLIGIHSTQGRADNTRHKITRKIRQTQKSYRKAD